jgi:tRNA-specific 2-thiouridylase
VEHLAAKSKGGAETAWDNFLLCCKVCNSNKGTKVDADCHWPHLNNTYYSLIYDETGRVHVNGNMSELSRKKAQNLSKDQSYVLYNMPKQLLGKVLFPLGNFESKEDVRKIAKEHNLSVASKPDSEDICFIPDGNYKKFLEQNSSIVPKEGNIVNRKGEILGRHTGLYNYTIGQRKGLGISYKAPLFVIGFNKERNEVIVGEQQELYRKEMKVNEVNLLLMDKIERTLDVTVKIRYASKPAEAIINQTEAGNIQVIFKEPQRGITPGQSAVFYIGDVVVGGGKIQN